MQDQVIFSIVSAAAWSLLFLVLYYQIEMRYHPIGKLRCKMGLHAKMRRKNGTYVRSYRCQFCQKPNGPELKVIQGEKKDLKSSFNL